MMRRLIAGSRDHSWHLRLCMEGSSDTSIWKASCAAMARTLCYVDAALDAARGRPRSTNCSDRSSDLRSDAAEQEGVLHDKLIRPHQHCWHDQGDAGSRSRSLRRANELAGRN